MVKRVLGKDREKKQGSIDCMWGKKEIRRHAERERDNKRGGERQR